MCSLISSDTRFGYFYLVAERVLHMKEAFQKAAVDGRFNDKSWKEQDNELVDWKRMVMDDGSFKRLYKIYAMCNQLLPADCNLEAQLQSRSIQTFRS